MRPVKNSARLFGTGITTHTGGTGGVNMGTVLAALSSSMQNYFILTVRDREDRGQAGKEWAGCETDHGECDPNTSVFTDLRGGLGD